MTATAPHLTGTPTAAPRTVTLEIDGRSVTVPEGTTVYDAAQSLGIPIPVLCHDPRLRPVGVCRMCVVEVEGARTLQASCVRPCEAGMKVRTEAALAVGTAVKCGFAPPDGGDVVDVIALVVRRDADVTAFSFANLPAHEQRRLDALVRRLGR